MSTGVHDVFISYSRRDAEFARRLHTGLEARDREVWIDWQDIPPTAEWWAEIRAAIDSANAFVFLMSEHSLASRVCAEELAHAAEARKRLIPVVLGEKATGPVPESLRPINWIYFREGAFEAGLDTLIKAVETDLEHVRRHTRLLVRAREWDGRGRHASFALRGHDLREAESWLSAGESKEPRPTPLHRAYITASRQGAARRQRMVLAATMVALAVTSVLAVVAVIKSEWAGEREREAQVQTAVARTQTAEAQRQREAAIRQRDLARRQANLALSRQLAAQAEALPASRATGLPTAALLAAEGLSRAHNPETVHAIHRVLPPLPYRLAHWPTNSNNVVFALSPSGRLAAWQVDDGETVINHRADTIIVSELDPRGRDRRFELDARAERMIFTPDEQMLIIATTSGEVRGIPLAGGPGWVTTVGERVTLLEFDAAGRLLIGAPGVLGALDPLTGSTLLGARLPEGILPVQFSPDGSLAVVVGWNQQARKGVSAFVSMTSATEVGQLPMEESSHDVVFSADGRRAALRDNLSATVVDVATCRVLCKIDVSDLGEGSATNNIVSLSLSPTGDRLATAEFDRTVRIWDVQSGRERLRIPQDGAPYLAVFSPDGRAIAVGADDDTARLWDAATGAELLRFTHGPGEYCSNLRFSRDGTKLITHAFATSVWDLTRTGEAFTVHHGEYVDRVVFSPDGRFFAAAGRDNAVSVWDSATGAARARLTMAKTMNGATSQVVFSPDGERLAALSEDGKVYIWALTSGEIAAQLGPATSNHLLVFSPDGRLLVTASGPAPNTQPRGPSSLTVWDSTTGARFAHFPTKSTVEAVAFSADGRLLACHREGEPITIVDLPDGANLKQVELTDEPADLEFTTSPAARGGTRVALMELILARRIRARTSDGRSLADCAWSPDGRQYVAGGVDHHTRIYDAATGREAGVLRHDGLLTERVAISPDGRLGASVANNIDKGSSDLWIFELPSGAPVVHLSFAEQARALEFSPDSSRLAIASDSGEIRGLLMRDEDLIAEARRRVDRPLSAEEREAYLGPADALTNETASVADAP